MSTDLRHPYHGALVGPAHCFAVRVYIEDTDLGGVVYHANYLRYLERARSDMLRAMGIDQRASIEQGIGVYAVAELRIRYVKPARLDDELVIVTRLEEIRGASCVLHQKITRGDDLVTEATVTAAFLGADGRPRRQPREWAERFRALQSRAAAAHAAV